MQEFSNPLKKIHESYVKHNDIFFKASKLVYAIESSLKELSTAFHESDELVGGKVDEISIGIATLMLEGKSLSPARREFRNSLREYISLASDAMLNTNELLFFSDPEKYERNEIERKQKLRIVTRACSALSSVTGEKSTWLQIENRQKDITKLRKTIFQQWEIREKLSVALQQVHNELQGDIEKLNRRLEGEINLQLLRHKWVSNITFLGTFAFLILASYILLKKITHPIQRLSVATKRLKNGDFDISIQEVTNDEIGSLTTTFNEMINRRKQAEYELKESEERFRGIAESMADWIWEVDANGRYTYCSEKVEEILGYTPEEMIGKTPFDFMPPNEAEQVGAAFAKIVAQKIPIKELKNWNLSKDNRNVCLLTNGIPVLAKNGDLLGYRGVDHDFTKQMRAEKALQESEEKYRSFAEQSLVGIYLIQDGVFKYANPKFAEIVGYTVDECLGNMPFLNLVHPDDAAKVEAQESRRLSGEANTSQYEFRCLRKGGEIINVAIFGSSVFHLGKPAAIGTMLDITERKRTENALQESEAFLHATGRMAKVGGWEIDLNSLEVRWTEETARIHEVPLSYVPPLDEAIQFYSPGERPGLEQAINRAIEYGEPYDREMRFITASGKRLWVQAICNPQIVDGKTDRLIGTFQDITDRKQSEAARIKLETQLQHANKMESLGTLSGGIAHDFNNILSSVIGFSELALDDEVSEDHPARYSLEQILKAGNRAKAIVQQILNFSRGDDEGLRPVIIAPIVEEVVKLLRASIPANIQIQYQTLSQEATVLAGPTLIHQVLMNLCTNAGHAMQDSGGVMDVNLTTVELTAADMIRISGVKPGPHIELSVSDTGHGIDPGAIDRIFDPYFTTKPKEDGTGLGLAAVSGMIKSLGGSITVESKLNEGSTFSIYIPQIQTKKIEAAGIHPDLPGGNERILLVDDEEGALLTMERSLEKAGYQVTAETSSQKTLTIFSENPEAFDLVITDYTMPHMMGDMLAAEIRKIRPDILIVMCTGYSERLTEERLKSIGVNALLLKPSSRREITESVRKILDG